MAIRNIDFTPGSHVRFGSLDFIVSAEGELEQIHAPPSLGGSRASSQPTRL